METYHVDIRANGDTDELVAEVYNDEDVVEATDRVYANDAFSATREGSTLSMTTGEFTADTTVLDVTITRFDDGFEVQVVGDDGELFTERLPDES